MSYENAARQQLHRRWWLRAVGVMACIVVFITVYALVLPAITMEGNPTCGLEEHEHMEDCYTADGVLICQLEEHTHDAACYAEAEEGELAEPDAEAEDAAAEALPAETVISAKGSDYQVEVSYDAAAGIPADASLAVEEILPGTEDYQRYMNQTLDSIGMGTGACQLSARFFDITILADGKEVEPAAPVNVVVTYNNAIADVQDGTVNAVHFGAAPELISAEAENVGEKTEIAFDAEQFSVYGIAYTVDFSYHGYSFSISGESKILISDLFKKLNVDADAANVAAVSFSDENLLSVEKQAGDWLLTSLKPFQTEETLTVTLSDGTVILIAVTDEAGDDSEAAFIRVQKQFDGITSDMIPEGFAITVAGNELKPDRSDPCFESASDDGLTWIWKLDELDTGTYSVSETNYEISDYNVETEGIGDVEVKAGGIAITGVSERINSCSNLEFSLSDTQIFVAKSTDDELAIVSKYSLSASQRAAVLEEVPQLGGNIQHWSDALFYSAENLEDQEYLYMRGVAVSVDFDNLTFTFPATKVWTQCGFVYAEPYSAQNADITITNTYTPKSADVSILKVNDIGNPLPGATFGLFTDEDCSTPLMIDGSPVTAVTGADGKATFSDVPSNATYYLKETAAPEGYYLNETVYTVTFEQRTVDGRTVNVGLVDGKELLSISNVHKPTIVLMKQDGETPLSGAEFTIEGPTVRGSYTSGDDGVIATIKNAENGNYTVTETHAPDGYYMLSDALTIEVKGAGEDDIIAKLGNTLLEKTPGEDEGGFIKYTIVIPNNPGVELPATGGPGTVVFTVSGLALMAAAMILLNKQRKRNQA